MPSNSKHQQRDSERNIASNARQTTVLRREFIRLAAASTATAAAIAPARAQQTTTIAPDDSLEKAVSQLESGETLQLRGGTYRLSSTVNVTASNITIRPAGDDQPLIDASALDRETDAISIGTHHATIQGLEIDGGGTVKDGIHLLGQEAHHNRIVNCEIHHVWTNGIAILNGARKTVISGCHLHHVNEPKRGDGLRTNAGSVRVENTVFSYNADDGFDALDAPASQPITISNSVAHHNGHTNNGVGFKIGRYGNTNADPYDTGGATVTNSIAYKNIGFGFRLGGNQPNEVRRSTAWQNGGAGFAVRNAAHRIYRCLALGNSQPIVGDVEAAVDKENSWNLGITPNVASTDPSSELFLRPVGVDILLGADASEIAAPGIGGSQRRRPRRTRREPS